MGLAERIRARADAVLALALFVAERLLGTNVPADEGVDIPIIGAEVATLLLGVAFTLSLWWRRACPLVPLALAFVSLALAGGASPDTSIALLLALVVTTYSVGAWSLGQWALIGALGVGALAGFAVLLDAGPEPDVGDIALGVLLVTGPWLAGLGVRNLRLRTARLEAEASRHAEEREEQLSAVVAEERASIARELHDVVAHAISIIVLQARGARRSVNEDPLVVSEALGVIEETGSQALAEMRRLVAVLRTGEEPPPLAPQPGLDDLAHLIDQFDEAGLSVTLTIEGTTTTLPPGLDLGVYRLVQEALTNTLHHAGPTVARVRVRYSDGELLVEVEDDGPGGSGPAEVDRDGAGMGLVGMRERVGFYGGRFEAGPSEPSGYRVTARLPLDAGS